MRLWLGGYSADMEGTGSGIGVLHAGAAAEQSARGALAFAGTAVEVDSPSWLSAHPTLSVVYAALEGEGAVQAFVRTGDETLRAMGSAVFTGQYSCHVAVSPDGSYLVATGYGDGNVAFILLASDGRLGEAQFGQRPVDPYAGTGPIDDPSLAALSASGFTVAEDAPVDTDLAAASAALRDAVGDEFASLIPDPSGGDEFARFLAEQEASARSQLSEEDAARLLAAEEAARIIADVPEETAAAEAAPGRVPHAHQARFLSRDLVATSDLGFDLIRLWRRTPAGITADQQIVLPKGAGPRHMVWHPSGHLYVVTEFSCEVYVLAPDASGRWQVVSSTPVARELDVENDHPGEISMSPSGEHLYAGVRGQNTIATLAVKDNGTRVEIVAATESHVNWPRHHVQIGDTLLIAGQRSNDVVSLAIDERTQIPAVRRSRTETPTPSALLPIFD